MGKDRVHLHFKSGRSIPKKRTPSYIWAKRRIWEVFHYLGLSSPDLKCRWTAVLFFSWEPGYIRHPSHEKDRVHLHFKLGKSIPKKKGPLRIYGLKDVSGSIPLFRSI